MTLKDQFEKGNDIIAGRNPVTEALRSGRSIDSILIAKGELNGSVKVIAAKAKAAKIPIKEVDRRKLERMCGGASHQGIVALAAIKEYASVDDIFALAQSRNEPPFIIVLDEIEDAHNLGAIIRTAECAGAHGVIIPKRRAAGLSYAVGKTSAGAYEYMPVAGCFHHTPDASSASSRRRRAASMWYIPPNTSVRYRFASSGLRIRSSASQKSVGTPQPACS